MRSQHTIDAAGSTARAVPLALRSDDHSQQGRQVIPHGLIGGQL